ncbi:Nuclear antigen EBNA-1 [Balamuthia mandrillaris]
MKGSSFLHALVGAWLLTLTLTHAQPAAETTQGECAVIVVNALAVEVSVGFDVGPNELESLPPGSCQLTYIPCQPDTFPFEVPVAVSLGISTYSVIVPFDTSTTSQQEDLTTTTEGGGGGGGTSRFVHYLVLSHRIRLPLEEERPEELVAVFPFDFEFQGLPIALLYEKAELPSEPLGEDEVGLAFWHVAAGAPFALRVRLTGPALAALLGEAGIDVTLDPYQRVDWRIIQLPPQTGQAPGGMEPPPTTGEEQPPPTGGTGGGEQPPSTGGTTGGTTGGGGGGGEPQRRQEEGIELTIEPAVPQQEVQTALAGFASFAAAVAGGGSLFEESIEAALRENAGELLTVFIITDPPELQQTATGGGGGVAARVFFTNCATDALAGPGVGTGAGAGGGAGAGFLPTIAAGGTAGFVPSVAGTGAGGGGLVATISEAEN